MIFYTLDSSISLIRTWRFERGFEWKLDGHKKNLSEKLEECESGFQSQMQGYEMVFE